MKKNILKNIISKRKVIQTMVIVTILSVATVKLSFAETAYTTKDKILSKGKIVYNDTATGEDVILDASDFTTLSNKLDEVFQSVSNGKALIASAITDQGVETNSDAAFQTMADNISILATEQYNAGKASSVVHTVGWACSYKDNHGSSATTNVYIGPGKHVAYVGMNSSSNSCDTSGGSNHGSISYSYNSSNGYVAITFSAGGNWTYRTCSANGQICYY